MEVYVIIHNIDGPMLRSKKVRTYLIQTFNGCVICPDHIFLYIHVIIVVCMKEKLGYTGCCDNSSVISQCKLKKNVVVHYMITRGGLLDTSS